MYATAPIKGLSARHIVVLYGKIVAVAAALRVVRPFTGPHKYPDHQV